MSEGFVPFQEDCVWHFALRYALPRTSTASTVVATFLETNLHRIRPETRETMANEIREAIADRAAGDCVDQKIWSLLATKLSQGTLEPQLETRYFSSEHGSIFWKFIPGATGLFRANDDVAWSDSAHTIDSMSKYGTYEVQAAEAEPS